VSWYTTCLNIFSKRIILEICRNLTNACFVKSLNIRSTTQLIFSHAHELKMTLEYCISIRNHMHEPLIYFAKNTCISITNNNINYVHEPPIYLPENTHFSNSSCIKQLFLSHVFYVRMNIINVRSTKIFSILILITFMYYVSIFYPITKLIFYK